MCMCACVCVCAGARMSVHMYVQVPAEAREGVTSKYIKILTNNPRNPVREHLTSETFELLIIEGGQEARC